MSRNMRRGAILAAWVLVVAVALFAVLGHERTLRDGELVLLKLAPVDPRSLMQGDYMALRFAADSSLAHLSEGVDGNENGMPTYAYFSLDERGRGEFAGAGGEQLKEPEKISMRIRMIDGRWSIGPNAFFFQEGTGERFESAEWGGFRVAEDGAALLVSLHDQDLREIGAQKR